MAIGEITRISVWGRAFMQKGAAELCNSSTYEGGDEPKLITAFAQPFTADPS